MGAIQCQQQTLVCRAHGVNQARALQTINDKVEHRVHRGGFHGIQQAADVVVGRDLERAKQRLDIALPLRLLHRALKVQKRRALHKKHRKRTQTGIRHRIFTVLSGPLIGKVFKSDAQLLDDITKVQAV